MTSEPVLLHYSSLGRRVLAYLLDLMILSIPCIIVGHYHLSWIGSVIILFFYAPILESSEIKATLGKYLLGIQVTNPMGQKISLRAAIIRNILKFFSTILLFIGYFFALFTKRKQTLHDLLAHTVVVYGQSELSIIDAWVASIRSLFRSNPLSYHRSSSVLSQLERLQSLRDKGALTEEEFQKQKRELLSD